VVESVPDADPSAQLIQQLLWRRYNPEVCRDGMQGVLRLLPRDDDGSGVG
jgi:hypothetical protein